MTDPVQKQFAAETKAVGNRRVKAVVSTENVDRDRDIIRAAGIDLSFFKTSPTVLFNHDPNFPIARAVEIGVEGNKLVSTFEFPPEGTSAKADEIYGLVKAGILNSTSIGFIPRSWEPIRGAEGHTVGREYKAVELLEFSVVSVPSNRQAQVIERAFRKENGLDEEGNGDAAPVEPSDEEKVRAKGRLPLSRARLNLAKLRGQHPAH
ncbi:HK97 family phage prohead protease [Salipiger pacificus]|nr:HK97 family phage prohead protease [Alloyangia pacifica]